MIFNSNHNERRKNPYFGKKFSILGDSISTLEGYNPTGYSLFYTGEICEKTGVREMQDTWWGKVIEVLGGELLVNNSWSGSRVSMLPGGMPGKLFPSGCSNERTGGLHSGSVKPDVIIVYLGINDWANGVYVKFNPAGYAFPPDIDEKTQRDIEGLHTFEGSFDRMLCKVKKNYPRAQVWCCTLCETIIPNNPSFRFPHTYAGTHIEEYNDVIRKVAKERDCKLIDLYSFRTPYASLDGTHPTADGMATIASMIIKEVDKVECAPSEHEFITADECTGYTKYVCKKCGLGAIYNMLDPKAFESQYAGSTVNGKRVKKPGINLVKCENGHFYDGNQFDRCPHCNGKRQEDNIVKKNEIEVQTDSDIIDLNPDCTSIFYSPEMGIRLFNIQKAEDMSIYKTEFYAGRRLDCNLLLTSVSASQLHASFMLVGDRWLLSDNQSTNGTWLNDTKLIRGKKYVLHPDDVIDFAHTEKYVFFKTQKQNHGNEDEKAVEFLEAGIKLFHDSDRKDVIAFKLITEALIKAPLYLPISIDIEAMLGGVDPTKLKPGEVMNPSKDVRMKVPTITANNTEYIPMFTSSDEVNKGTSVSTMRMSPRDYLLIVIPMGKDVIINPFGDAKFIYTRKIIEEIVWPLVKSEAQQPETVQSNETEDLSGQTVGDRYELLEQIGLGGYFQVYLGKDKSNKKYSIKVCDKYKPGMGGMARSALLQEPHLMMQFNHPAIPKVFDIVEDDRHLFVVREYVDGEALSTLLSKNGPLTVDRTVELGIELADVLQYLHTHTPPYIYRDMKPANVIITPSGAVRLIDFGIVMQYGPNAKEEPDFLGTKGYAAPEQISGGTIDSRADIFGLGVTLHQCITGISPNLPPYETPPIRTVNPALPKGLEYIISKCIEPDPDDRYQSCVELIADLSNYQNLPLKKGLFANLFAGNRIGRGS